jgi:hypothetical protein
MSPKDKFLTFVKTFTNHKFPSPAPFPFLSIANFMENSQGSTLWLVKLSRVYGKTFKEEYYVLFQMKKTSKIYTHATIHWNLKYASYIEQ